MSPERSRLNRALKRLSLGLRLWRRDRDLWKLKEKADHSRMLAELYSDRWARDERFNRGNPLDRLAAERYGKRTQELDAQIESYGRSEQSAPPEYSMLGER